MPNPDSLPAFYFRALNGYDSYALASVYEDKKDAIQAQKYHLNAIALGVFRSKISYADARNAGTAFLLEGNYSAAVNCYRYALLKEHVQSLGNTSSQKVPEALTALKRLHRAGYVFDTQLPGFALPLTKLPRRKETTSGKKTRKYDTSDLRKEVLLKKISQTARRNLPKEAQIGGENSLLAHLSIDEYYAMGLKHQEYAANGEKTGEKLEDINVVKMYATRCFLHAAAQGDSNALITLRSYAASDLVHLRLNIDIALLQFKQILYPESLNILDAPSSSDQTVDSQPSTLLLNKSSFWPAQSSQIAPPTPARSEVATVSLADDSTLYIDPETTETDINKLAPLSLHVDNEPEVDIVIPAGETDSDLTLHDDGIKTDSSRGLSSFSEEDPCQYTSGLSL